MSDPEVNVSSAPSALRLRVRGTVQGVGYRPFVHRLARGLGLGGWVRNDGAGVLVYACGSGAALAEFRRRLADDAPPAARVEAVVEEPAPDAIGASGGTAAEALPSVPGVFEILESATDPVTIATAVPADLAMCGDCARELADPSDRRHGYPFINCTQCGPRYTIIESLPYDRPRTAMRAFPLCAACAAEYADPGSRRHHAEPNACPVCGPRVFLADAAGARLAEGGAAIEAAAAALADGAIVAVKGVGGYHLCCDAAAAAAVAALRRRKHRDAKPFAVLFPDLEALRREAEVDEAAAAWLRSPEAPIVLVPRRTGGVLPDGLAPGNPWLGALLPYAPLQVLLLRRLARPLVATSANLAEEPLCTEEEEARHRLAGIADLWLCHDRRIVRPVDDSVLRPDGEGGAILLRRARGYAPAPLRLPGRLPAPVLGAGVQMKATVAVAAEDRVVVSPHIGDLDNASTQRAYENTVAMLGQLLGAPPTTIACDLHPGYASTRWAERSGRPLFPVQHHLAHLLACLLDNGRAPEDVLGVIWDGTGHGEDGSVWGGEFLRARGGTVERFAHLRPFGLPGGDAAAREARRVVLALRHELEPEGTAALARALGWTEREAGVLAAMLERGLNAPRCTSLGRLFDAAGLLLGLGRENRFEGQLPLAVEAAAWEAVRGRKEDMATRGGDAADGPPLFELRPSSVGDGFEADWAGALALLADQGLGVAQRAETFHRGLAALAVAVARKAGVRTVALSGGCFQNARLLGLVRAALREAGLEVLCHRQLPPGDGGIAAGQVFGALLGLGRVRCPSCGPVSRCETPNPGHRPNHTPCASPFQAESSRSKVTIRSSAPRA